MLKLNIAHLTCILILWGFPEVSMAQFGAKLGTTISSFYYTDKEMNPNLSYDIDLRPYLGYDIEWVQLGNQKPVVYAYLGAYYNYKFSNRFGLRPEVSFTQKGVSFSQSEYESIIYKVKISYLEVPLSIAYKIIKKEKFESELYLGGYGAFKLNAVKRVAFHNSSTETTNLSTVEKFDAGIHFGMNFKYKLFEKFVLLDIRVFQGLMDIFNMPEDQPILYHTTQKTKTTGLYITLGYEF